MKTKIYLLLNFLCLLLSMASCAQSGSYEIELSAPNYPTFQNAPFIITEVIDERVGKASIGFVQLPAAYSLDRRSFLLGHLRMAPKTILRPANLTGGVQYAMNNYITRLFDPGDTSKLEIIVGVKQLFIKEEDKGLTTERCTADLQLSFYKKVDEGLCLLQTTNKRVEEKKFSLTYEYAQQIRTAIEESIRDFILGGTNQPCLQIKDSGDSLEKQITNESSEDDFVSSNLPNRKQEDKLRPDRGHSLFTQITSGISNLPGNYEDQKGLEKEFNEKLSSGQFIDGSVEYFPKLTWGFGLNANFFRSAVHFGEVIFVDTIANTQTTGELSDDIAISSYLAKVGRRFNFNHDRSFIYLGASLGLNRYVENGVFINPISIVGHSYCSRLQMSLNTMFKPHMGMGIHGSYGGGSIQNVYVTIDGFSRNIHLDKSDAVETHHLDFGVSFFALIF